MSSRGARSVAPGPDVAFFTGAAALGWLAWRAAWSPDVAFFVRRAPAEWVLHATPSSVDARPATAQRVAFRTHFELDRVPERATLRVRVHRRGSALVNGVAVRLPPAASWKRVREVDVSAWLRAGRNELVVGARASRGPPAAWVVLEGPGLLVASDETWTSRIAGEPWSGARPVRLATRPMSEWGERPRGARTASVALRQGLPWLAAFALASGAALVAGRRFGVPPAGALIAASALAFGLLCWHNRGLDPELGFDASAHLDYIRLLLAERRLPLADEGWETYQPPLYYAAGAALLQLSGGSAGALRWLNALAAVASAVALLGSLRILFPSDPRRVVAGFALGASAPMQLYLAQYVTNEVWAAAFASLAIWLALRILARRDARLPVHLGLGALLGAALLVKFSTLLALAAVLAALTARLVASGERRPRAWMHSVGAVALATVAVAGWHYARVALRFGDPFVGNWDAAAGVAWWQDPGYRTLQDYLRFGESLTRPVFSAFHSCPDALYSTLWGDGLLGGSAHASGAPPWSQALMFSGYWLALLPSIGVAIGLATALRRIVREPCAEWFLVLALAGATGFALVALSLELPFYAQCKAFYGLQALVPFAAFGAVGLDRLAQRLGRAGDLVWVLFGTWALCAWATYWVR